MLWRSLQYRAVALMAVALWALITAVVGGINLRGQPTPYMLDGRMHQLELESERKTAALSERLIAVELGQRTNQDRLISIESNQWKQFLMLSAILGETGLTYLFKLKGVRFPPQRGAGDED